MKGSFDLLQQIGDAVGVETGTAAAETSESNAEGRSFRGPARHEPPAQGLVDDIPKGAAGPPTLSLQLRRHVIVQRQGRAHIMMIGIRHHDVKMERQDSQGRVPEWGQTPVCPLRSHAMNARSLSGLRTT